MQVDILNRRPLIEAQHLRLYSLFRLGVATTLLVGQWLSLLSAHKSSASPFAIWVAVMFFVYASGVCVLNWRPRPKIKITTQTIADIVFVILIMHCFSNNQSGIGLLLVITIVFASLMSDGRHAIFYAAIATIGILLETSYQVVMDKTSVTDYSNGVLLSLSCFAIAWLAHTLAVRMQKSEKLASERGLDIEQLAKTNALITQEMPNGVLVIDSQHVLKHFNTQACKLLGVHADVLNEAMAQGAPLEKVIPSLIVLWQPSQTRVLPPEHAIKLSLPNRDLGIRFHALSEGDDTGVVIFIEDWSQIQTQAHQVKLAALGRLTANIAHEIRNPLSAISHANQLLQEEAEDPATVRMLQIIADNVQRLDQIIKDVLELNRRDRTNQEMFLVNHFVQDFYQQFCAVEKIEAPCFELKGLSKDSEVVFDKRHINQILWNLCKNGWRHGQQSKQSLKLSISNDKSGQFVHVVVKDDGRGIDPKIQPHIFEPFMTTEKTGTGLGLYIARELAEANGAKLTYVTSEQGTQFTLTIKKALA